MQRQRPHVLYLHRTLGAGLAAMLLVAGCTETITAKTVTLPTPLIEPLPVTVGVYYSPELRTNEPTVRLPKRCPWCGSSMYKLSVGPAAAAMLERVFAAMFERTVVVASRPPLPAGGSDVAAVIEPAITFNVGRDFISIGIYLTLYAADGASLKSWSASGTGPGTDAAAALRDAAAVIMTEFAAQPEVKEWLSSIGEPGGDGS